MSEELQNALDPDRIGAICSSCAARHGADWPKGHLATFWLGRCGACNSKKIVTSPSDYLWPRLGKTALNMEEVD